MSNQLRIVMAQLNLLVGDIKGNTELVVETAKQARFHYGAHAIVFPELTLTGYPPEDLLLRQEIIFRIDAALEEIFSRVSDIDIILGYPYRVDNKLYNMAAVIRDGEIVASYNKQLLPNYSVFDEKRYFEGDDNPCLYA